MPIGKPTTLHRKEKTPSLGFESGRWDSNPRPSPWQGDILPTEPRPQCFLMRMKFYPTFRCKSTLFLHFFQLCGIVLYLNGNNYSKGNDDEPNI